MNIPLECKKLKRTGFFVTFLVGGILAVSFPILNMVVRSSSFTGMDGAPIVIMLKANWQMMAMMNVLLLVIGSCIMYHTEYAENAMQKMRTMPVKEIGQFGSKFALLCIMSMLVLSVEAVTIGFCISHWFGYYKELVFDILKNFGFSLLLLLPVALFLLIIASTCQNMWVSLGVSVICVFTGTLIPLTNFVLTLFPFALPFQIFAVVLMSNIRNYMIAAVIEIITACIVETVILKVRRSLE